MGYDNGISNIPVDAVMHADHDLRHTQTRSVGIAPRPIGHRFDDHSKPFLDNYVATQPPKLKSERGFSAYPIAKSTTDKNNGPVQVPVKPFYIAKTNFLCFLSIVDIISKVEKRLNSILEVSYQFMHNECMWDAVYLRGSSHCKFQIHVFKEDSKSFIIEGNRLSGDGFPFRRIYDDLKADFSSNFECQCETRDVFGMGMGFTSGVSVPSSEPLSDTEASAAIKPIIDMAKSGMIDSQIEASAILCDLSAQEDMQQFMCEGGCVKVLTDLLCKEGEFQNSNFHAICALANLSSSVSCQELLASTPAFLTTLLRLSADGPYYSAEVRRESARILANICERHSVKVLNSVDNGNIRSWMNGVEEIKDERLRTHASRAKFSLNSCTAVY
jgi:hypothetical protein